MKFLRKRYLLLGVLIALLSSCRDSDKQKTEETLFELISSQRSGIFFENTLKPDFDNNIFEYDYFYNGGGVAAADFNNDGLTDLFFSGNQVAGKLYMNKGNFQFEDITGASGIQTSGWCTGVSVADVNGDGWPDIYVSHAGLSHSPNQLFISSGKQQEGGKVKFLEKAKEYGLDYQGFSTQAAFFDYDRDGDLDMYLLNHFHEKKNPNYPKTKTLDGSAPSNDKLFRNNENTTFTEVGRASGIINEGFGLGIAISDLNHDNWPDIYVANDYAYDDLVYINNGDGTFTEKARQYIKHTSRFAMGCDIADFNNDLLPDIYVVDMLPNDNKRQKLMSIGISNYVFNYSLQQGYLPQYSRNTLQLHNGLLPNGDISFSEIGQLAGVYKTDWSWSALFADLDNDGWKDLFVSNGIPKDITNIDFTMYRSGQFNRSSYDYDEVKRQLIKELEKLETVDKPNFVFRNKGDLTFEDKSRAWGLDKKGFSNGTVLADLDNDGDLDLVTNNINAEPFVFRNNSEQFHKNNYLALRLKGHFSQGTKVKVVHGRNQQYLEHNPYRGFQSTQEDKMHIGLGEDTLLTILEIVWPDGRYQQITGIVANQTLILEHGNAGAKPVDFSIVTDTMSASPLFTDITASAGLDIIHQENKFEDFNLEPLVPHRFSRNGPQLASGDMNGDELQDFWMSGAASIAGKLFFQQNDGTFISKDMPDPGFEDAQGSLFDADNDKDLDLYVVSGGNEYNPLTATYQDRLYLNDGRGNFIRSERSMPVEYASGSCVQPADFDGDGDTDLFVGGRVVPGRYPLIPESFILLNDGKGNFTNITQKVCPVLSRVGMVTDALWIDIDNDHFPELMVVGEFMPVSIFKNNKGLTLEKIESSSLSERSGWWYSIEKGDFDGDGDQDFIAGNLGLNNRWNATPVRLYAKPLSDISVLPIITYFLDKQEYTLAGRDQIASVYPAIKARFNNYQSFAIQTFAGIFPKEETASFNRLEANEMRSMYIENKGNWQFLFHPLPIEAQFAPVQSIQTGDFNNDGNRDVLLFGNDHTPDFMTGRYDASPSLVLIGNGYGQFTKLPYSHSGFFIQEDTRSSIEIEVKGKKSFVIGSNAAPLRIIRWNGKRKSGSN
ncbi:VCBS repeat-containing protein [Rhodocytophaga rosea]|uniref:VCBS repeat-containing protein n=1 Tax=Rhodocytophaga rosea TaxID=2704465 RepID=A0A6C0GI32_9BACT|nr:VCBS repeat-containing protein [Rhodocytophaga rosea]QHT67380.1 VCBS repeat-containing protein [Rhodocytophaga rosea]